MDRVVTVRSSWSRALAVFVRTLSKEVAIIVGMAFVGYDTMKKRRKFDVLFSGHGRSFLWLFHAMGFCSSVVDCFCRWVDHDHSPRHPSDHWILAVDLLRALPLLSDAHLLHSHSFYLGSF